MNKILVILLLLVSGKIAAQNYTFNFNTTGQRVCLVDAEVNTTVPSVTLHFLDAASNTSKTTYVFRRPLYGTGAQWTAVATNLPAGTQQWTDTDVTLGQTWEYQVKRSNTWFYNGESHDATGYTVGCLLRDNSNYQGQMILLVADNITIGAAAKYRKLKKELTGDGWFVNEIIVPRAHGWDSGDTVVGIRNQVKAVYTNAPANDKPKMLFILGHVPMPRSGSANITAPDAHDQNKGARGCDGYYADIDGIYTDVNTYNPGGLATPLAINLPGDSKWDQDFFPSSLEMAFGRVDFADLLDHSLTELQLTERYLDRLSRYRLMESGSDMGNKTGFFIGYDNSNDGSYRTLPNISGTGQVFQNTAGAPHPQWVQNNGPFKVYMQNANFPEIGEWQTYGMNATLYSSDQSYWGFNDEPEGFYYSRIRALLSENTKCLIMLWTTTAANFFHQACSGDPLGSALKAIMDYNTVNNNLEKPEQNWDHSDWWNRTHFSFNGDPTLRLYQLAPPSNLAITNVNNQAVLSWGASPAQPLGYHVYKSSTEFGIYTRITSSAITSLNYTIPDYHFNDWYMVRAVKPETSGCGTFLHPSAGIFLQGDLTLSLAEKEEKQHLKIFPNPASHELTVSAEQPITSVRIFTTEGREVFTAVHPNTNTITFNLSGLTAGIYLIEVGNGKEMEVSRIVVE